MSTPANSPKEGTTVTTIVLAGEALRISEARYRALFELGPMAVYCCDATGVIQEFNHRAAELWGRSPVPGDTDQKFCGALKLLRPDGSFMSHSQSPIAEVLRGALPSVCDAEVVIERPDGTQVTVIVNIRPQKNEREEITGAINCFYDITSRRQAEEAQHRAEVLAASNHKLEQEILHRQTVESALRTSQATSNELLENSRQMQEQLRQLSHQALQAQEEERKRISRELHDVIAQTLTGINVRLSLLQKENCTSTQELREKIAQTQQLVAQSVDTVHRFARDLRPAMLDDLGLIPALEAYLADFSKQTGLEVSLRADASVEELGSIPRTVLYRVAQEALTNVVRHARASRVEVSLQKNNGSYCMVITDNGQGFVRDNTSTAKSSNRLGLLGMRERVEIIGGTFCVDSVPGQHTTVLVEIPAGSNELRKNSSPLHEPHHHPAG
jgi:signal transduction histidine kinase